MKNFDLYEDIQLQGECLIKLLKCLSFDFSCCVYLGLAASLSWSNAKVSRGGDNQWKKSALYTIVNHSYPRLFDVWTVSVLDDTLIGLI